MNEALNAPENGYSISRFALWAWILSFGYTLGDTFVRIALWFQGGEQGAWTLSALAAAWTNGPEPPGRRSPPLRGAPTP